MLTEKEYCENQELLPIVAGSSSKAGGGIAGSAGRGPGAPAISGAAGAIFILIYLTRVRYGRTVINPIINTVAITFNSVNTRPES